MSEQPRLFTPTYGGGWSASPALNEPDQPVAERHHHERALPPHQLQSHTSRAAARAIQPHAPGLRAMLLDALRHAGHHGLTIAEASVELTRRRGATVKESTICGRLSELRDLGRVIDSGRTRLGDAGVGCVVWTIRDNGSSELNHER